MAPASPWLRSLDFEGGELFWREDVFRMTLLYPLLHGAEDGRGAEADGLVKHLRKAAAEICLDEGHGGVLGRRERHDSVGVDKRNLSVEEPSIPVDSGHHAFPDSVHGRALVEETVEGLGGVIEVGAWWYPAGLRTACPEHDSRLACIR